MKAFVGITGASGSVYGVKLTLELLNLGFKVYLCFSQAGKIVASEELEIPGKELFKVLREKYFGENTNLVYLEDDEIDSPPASGSSQIDYYFIAPCSVSTLSHIAYGLTRNLIHRAADVALKERRKLILVLRETPLSTIHLEAMLKVSNAGAIVLPASPAFYHHPKSIDDLVNFVIGKALDAAGINNSLYKRYKQV